MKCNDCCYFWADCNDKGEPIGKPYCHYQYNDGYAPCEIEDNETPDADE